MSDSARRVRPVTFFVLTFVLSWAVWIPLDLAHFGVALSALEASSSSVRLLGVLMPAVAAIILTARSEGLGGLRSIARRLVAWRVRWQWWVVAVLVHPAVLVAVALIYNALEMSPPIVPAAPAGAGALIVNGLFLLIATLGEEIGWRGAALPALMRRRGPLVSSAILGILWAVWHLPFWLLLDTYDSFGVLYLVLNILLVVPSAFYITWFFIRSGGSLLLPVLFHIAFNLVNVVWLPVTLNLTAFIWMVAAEWVLGTLAVVAICRRHPRARAPKTAPSTG